MGRREAMDWCEKNRVQYVFGLSKNATLDALVFTKADEVHTQRATANLDVMRDYTETLYAAKSWPHPVASWHGSRQPGRAAILAMSSPTSRNARPNGSITASIGPRGQAENLIKRHKSQLASNRTSCRSPLANQMRLILHSAAYWLMLAVRHAIPAPQPVARGEFSTIRLRLLKIAVRIKETASRIRLAFAANCPDAALFRGLLGTLILRPTWSAGRMPLPIPV
jgi:hypothetical protein